MSIKGIDAQMMITRLPDTSRDASVMQKRPEITQDFMAIQNRIMDAQDQSKVVKMNESEMENIRSEKDKDGDGHYEGGGQKHGSGSSHDETQDKNMLVPPGDHKIDIRI